MCLQYSTDVILAGTIDAPGSVGNVGDQDAGLRSPSDAGRLQTLQVFERSVRWSTDGPAPAPQLFERGHRRLDPRPSALPATVCDPGHGEDADDGGGSRYSDDAKGGAGACR